MGIFIPKIVFFSGRKFYDYKKIWLKLTESSGVVTGKARVIYCFLKFLLLEKCREIFFLSENYRQSCKIWNSKIPSEKNLEADLKF